MKKAVSFAKVMVLIIILFGISVLIHDKCVLRNNIIRLHVVANSNSEYDQFVKLAVKDGIVAWLQENLQDDFSSTDAKLYIYNRISDMESVANEILKKCGISDEAVVTLKKEAFDTRTYDTFTLPAGVYESLRVEIGEGTGRNWWCVVFPALCLPASSEEFCQTAVDSGMDNGLAETLSGEKEFEFRFYLLDLIGKIENLFPIW